MAINLFGSLLRELTRHRPAMSAFQLLVVCSLPLLFSHLHVTAAPFPGTLVVSQDQIRAAIATEVNRSMNVVVKQLAQFDQAFTKRWEKMKALLQRSLMPDCRHPWKVINDNFCLFKPPFKRTWLEGKHFCRSIGGELATIRSEPERTSVKMLDLNNGLCPWIGLHYDVLAKKYVWSSGSTAPYRKWEIGEPNHKDFYNRNITANCVYACPTGMGDHDCGFKNEFVCEKRRNTHRK